MTRGPVDAYLRRLERELQQRELEAPRMVEEAREHLVDAVEEARQRGLSEDEAAREAFERFGAPETVAAHVVSERDRMMIRFGAVLDTVWRRKWWILAPTVLTALVTSVMSYYFLPTRYRSESVIRIESPRVPAEYVRTTTTEHAIARFQRINQVILSRSRLERVINDFGLYRAERERTPLSDLVQQMRRDINVTFHTLDRAPDQDAGGFSVSFVSSDPNLAMKTTERLAAMIVQQSLEDKERQVEGTTQFLEAQIADVRSRLIAYEKTLEDLRAKNGSRTLSQADVLPYGVLQERYKALLIQAEESRMAANVERRQIGEQFKIYEGARLPQRPVGPSRASVNILGTLAGLGLGLVSVGVRRRWKETSG